MSVLLVYVQVLLPASFQIPVLKVERKGERIKGCHLHAFNIFSSTWIYLLLRTEPTNNSGLVC